MTSKKKTWVTPRLQRLKPTPELLELFKDQLEQRELAADSRPRRFG